MDVRDLWKLDATAQAALVRAGEVTAPELLEAAIERIERINPSINAVITPLYELAREQAAEIERSRGLKIPRSMSGGGASVGAPFPGVPLLLKDAGIEVAGTPYHMGTRVLRDIGYRSKRTTEHARRLRAAGFVFAGKANCPELSAGITTEPVAFGPTRNPWDLTRSTAGSSGGSAAAVAAGLTSIAHGSDGTGSLRYPASVCGLVTLKASRGLVPSETPAAQPDVWDVWTEGVLARSVRDITGWLEAIAGVASGDLQRPPERLRIGLLKSDVMLGFPTDAECVRGVGRAGALLSDLGHDVEEARPPALEGLFRRTAQAMMTGGRLLRYEQNMWLSAAIGRPLTKDDVEAESFVSKEEADAVTKLEFEAAIDGLLRETAPILDWWAGGWDVLVTPATRQPAWPLGSNKGAADSGVFPPPFSFTGQPAMSLPLHWSQGGLPVGVQFVGDVGRDALLLRLAAQLERAAPWAERWPAIAGA